MFDGMDDGRVAYRESGELLLECGQSLRAEQRYVYETMEDGFAVSFHTTGELFQRVVFAACAGDGWKGSASHSCKADVYDSEYVFRRDGMFVVRHEVRGPKKDYVIRTEYRRGQIGLE